MKVSAARTDLGRLGGDSVIEGSIQEPGSEQQPAELAPRPSQLNFDQLTDREAKVVELVLEGLTNPEIGERLGISRRTVSSHLSAVFRKLGVRSRIDLIIRAPDIGRQSGEHEK
ncbi:MAG: helix-turn-helix domain-containing protein [Actinomycetota bacterium]